MLYVKCVAGYSCIIQQAWMKDENVWRRTEFLFASHCEVKIQKEHIYLQTDLTSEIVLVDFYGAYLN